MNLRSVCSLDANTKKLFSLSKSTSDIYGERKKKSYRSAFGRYWLFLRQSRCSGASSETVRWRLCPSRPFMVLRRDDDDRGVLDTSRGVDDWPLTTGIAVPESIILPAAYVQLPKAKRTSESPVKLPVMKTPGATSRSSRAFSRRDRPDSISVS